MRKFYFLLIVVFFFTGINAQIISFPDMSFKAKLLEANDTNGIAINDFGSSMRIDANSNGEIEVSEALQVSKLLVSNSGIENLDGINYFINLNYLKCSDNQLTNLNLNQNTQLVTLYCQFNQLSTLDLSQNASLKYLYCEHNLLSSLSFSSNSQLENINCTYNELLSIDLSTLNQLRSIGCNNNFLTSLDLNSNPLLSSLGCSNNQLSSLNTELNPLLNSISCDSNPDLIFLNIKNSSGIGPNSFDLCPSLSYICADENELTVIGDLITQYGYTTCHVNSYCSFTPGGTFYTIQGNTKLDNDNNGCDVSDNALSNLKFTVTDGINSGSLVSNTSGNYSIPVQAGTHTITPIFENPTYFTASPTSRVVTFPTQTSPVTQDFCITANGVHSDLEVTLVPIRPARPSFDAIYKLVYKNKGNQTQSGSVSLTFNDAVLDFVSSAPLNSNQAINNLTWDFSNLQPFETREITITLNVNSPLETPAVNAGDVLNYIANITSAAADDMPEDNTLTFHQTVVNSFDPNDKTCLEGATIAPSEVGKYVHYMIRFENTGTFPAENIVVKDMIDTAKFDINSLVPIKGSHSFVTNITAGNKVEFIFENINLPFDDANNDGYVAFKIKTKPTLVNGDTFTNTASIYFDYNFPIVTNTATTTIAALSAQDFGFSSYFILYPNPVNDVLTLETKQTIEVSSINIYNQLGQLVLVVPNAQNVSKVDVSGLASGNYFIKVNSDKGTSNTKFVKK